jgi:RNA polymerase sigma factor (sigma-70 family)
MAKGKFDQDTYDQFRAAREAGDRKTADRHRNTLVEENRFLAVKMANNFRKFTARHMDLQDLIQAGIVGLITAIERFDPNRGKFGTYAAQYIHMEMQDASLRDQPVYRPRSDYLRQVQIKVMERIRAKEGREATPEELGCSPEALRRHLERVKPLHMVTSAKDEGEDGRTRTVENLIPSTSSTEELLATLNRETALAGISEADRLLFLEKYQENIPYKDLEKKYGQTKYMLGMRLMRARRRLELLLHGEQTNRRYRKRGRRSGALSA